MIRTFNYTGRKRIPQSQIQLNIVEQDKALGKVDAAINLDDLFLPADASLYLEAYSRSGVKRYSFGKVNKVTPAKDLSLPSTASVENLLFRVLVVDESGAIGRIVAVADKLKVTTTAKGTTRSILPVVTDDIGKLVWKIDFGEEIPTLVLNYNIPDVMNVAATDVRFFQYVYPAVIKEILTHLIWVEGIEDPEDLNDDDWQLQWLRFTEQYVSTELRPVIFKESMDFDSELVNQWIGDVVKEFCIKNIDSWDIFINEFEVKEK